MKNERLALTWAVTLSLCALISQASRAQETSTPEERARWAEIAHKLESNALDDRVNKDGEWALKRLSDVHDIHVPLCSTLLGQFNDSKYKYRHEVTRQYMLASGAFMIENPGRTADTNAMNLAAVESVLKVYTAIVQEKPDAKWKFLEDLLKRQSEGKLDEFVKKTCGAR